MQGHRDRPVQCREQGEHAVPGLPWRTSEQAIGHVDVHERTLVQS